MVKVFRVISRLNIGGPAQHAILLASHLNGQEWSSTLITGQIDRHEGDMLDLAYRRGLHPIVIATLRNESGVVADLISLLRLYRLFRRERPTIVHLHLFKARLLGGVAARLAGVPIIVESFHGTLFTGYYPPVVSWLLVGIERALARLMRAVIAVSNEVAQELIRLRIVGPEKIYVIPVGLELDRFVRAHDSQGTLRTALGLDETQPLVGTVGRLVPIKGVRYFLAAAARVIQAVPRARFVIIGDGPERGALERQTVEEGLGDRVVFLGWRRDLERVYPDLDVVVLTSINEGTPAAVIEAMAAGRPVVATQVGGVPDVVQDGVTGRLIPPRDPAALAEAVVRLLRDPVERQRMGTAARVAASPRFSAARLASDMEVFYQELLCAKTPKRTAAFTVIA